MAIEERLYRIRSKKDPNDLGRLIVAAHPAQAMRHVANDVLECTLPSALEAAELVKKGVSPERVNGPAPDDPPPPDDPPF